MFSEMYFSKFFLSVKIFQNNKQTEVIKSSSISRSSMDFL